MACSVALAAWSRARALVRALVVLDAGSRPMFAGSEAAQTAGTRVVVLNMISRHAVLTYPGLVWPGSGGARPQERVIGDSIIAVIYSDTFMSMIL